MNTPTFKKSHFKIKNNTFNTISNENFTFMEIRQHLLNRDTIFEIIINNNSSLFVTSNQGKTAISYLENAYSIRCPFVNDDFDYLKQNVRKVQCRIRSLPYSLIITYKIQYLTTLIQEKCITCKLNEIIESMKINEKKNDFLKTKCVYDFILSNIEYDHTNTNRSAYNALFDKKAVCEGCAALLYRMLSLVNIPCRIITGDGFQGRHAWNIVKIGGYWYNLDVTWDLYCRRKDRTLTDYKWFLKGEQSFSNHIRDPQYSDNSFLANHVMANVDYYN